jgi:hypothetical protein
MVGWGSPENSHKREIVQLRCRFNSSSNVNARRTGSMALGADIDIYCTADQEIRNTEC